MTPKIRLFYLIGTLDVGGSEGQLVQLVTRLDPADLSPWSAACRRGGPYAEAPAAAGIPVEIIGFRGFRIFRHPHRVAAQMFRLVRAMRRAQPDPDAS